MSACQFDPPRRFTRLSVLVLLLCCAALSSRAQVASDHFTCEWCNGESWAVGVRVRERVG